MKVNGSASRTIQPGETDTVSVTISVGNRRGKTSRKVRVETNDRERPAQYLECVAIVKSALEIEPVAVNFGNIERTAGPQTKTLTVRQGEAGPIHPKVISTGHPQVNAEVKEIKEGEQYEVVVTAEPPWPNGMLRGNLLLDTGVEKTPQERVTVFARIMPRLTAIPNRFSIPREFNRDLELTSRLKWSDGAPGHVLEATVDDPSLTVEVREANDMQTIVLHVPVDFDPGVRPRFSVKVKTDDEQVPELDIPIYAMRPARPRPGQTVSPTEAGRR